MANRKLLDKTIVIDLEATCWEDRQPPAGQQSEIIEIGVCLLDNKTGERSDKRGILIKPEKSKLSNFCTSLTTLTQDEVDDGMSLQQAFHILEQDYQSKKRSWASWGHYDMSFLVEQASVFGLKYPMSREHINLKNVFALKFKLDKEVGLDRALKMRNIEMSGTHHRGKDDAWNTAALMWEILR